MKKILLAVLTLIVTIFTLTACGEEKTPTYHTDKTLTEICEEMQTNVQFAMQMPVTSEELVEYYELDSTLFSDIVYYAPMMVNSDTIIIGKVADMTRMEEAKTYLDSRLQAVISSFEFYLPDPYELAKQGQIVDKGDYVMLIISTDNEKCIEIFNNSIIED